MVTKNKDKVSKLARGGHWNISDTFIKYYQTEAFKVQIQNEHIVVLIEHNFNGCFVMQLLGVKEKAVYWNVIYQQNLILMITIKVVDFFRQKALQ